MFQDLEGKGGPSGDSETDLPGGTPDDANFMNLLNSLAGDMMKGDAGQQELAMDKILGEFSSFIKDAEGNEEMKTALESVVEQIISKDSLYEPMKQLKEEFPGWLEKNWDKISQEDLEKYNKQVDKIEQICKMYETSEGSENKEIFEHLS
jgi:peroxin-19